MAETRHNPVFAAPPGNIFHVSVIVAVDAQPSKELDWKSSLSYQAGFEFRGARQLRVRLMPERFDGRFRTASSTASPRGYTGLGLYFRF